MDKVTISFYSKFGNYQEEIEVERLLTFDLNPMDYEHYERMCETQRHSVLYNCTNNYWEDKFRIRYEVKI